LRQVQRRIASSIGHWPGALYLLVLAVWGVGNLAAGGLLYQPG
jgi:hypothetical protein